MDAVSENMAAALFANHTAGDDEEDASSPSGLSLLLEWHAATWDQFRAFLRPRVLRVYPENMARVWRAYVRLAAIDLALRAAAHLHIAGASPAALEFLEFASVGRRGECLNGKRAEAGIPLDDFAEAVGVSDNAAQAWLYDGARPTDGHLACIATALAADVETEDRNRLLRELRRLYWVSDVAEVLGGFIGMDEADEIVGRLHRYAARLYGGHRRENGRSRKARCAGQPRGRRSPFRIRQGTARCPHSRRAGRGMAGGPEGRRVKLDPKGAGCES